MKIFFKILILLFYGSIFSSCNLLLVAVRNVPVFFETPQKVKNKISQPVREDVRLSALWIGHATVLIQMDDKIIITDPFLSETAGEFARRVVEPGIDERNIPACDIVLISHSHFDHLNYYSLEILEEKSISKNLTFDKNFKSALVFPEDTENYLPGYNMKMIRLKNDKGYTNSIIGESAEVNGIKLTAVYAQHWGGRYGVDGYVWGDNAFTGYIIEYNGMTVYFAGDTGYDPVKFSQLGKKFNIDLAFIPIGPCADCNQCGTYNHVFPQGAYSIFKDLKAKWMIPIHYGTLHFAQADPLEPLQALREIVKTNKAEEKVHILNIGEQKIFIKK